MLRRVADAGTEMCELWNKKTQYKINYLYFRAKWEFTKSELGWKIQFIIIKYGDAGQQEMREINPVVRAGQILVKLYYSF